jgi:hypothetical protein
MSIDVSNTVDEKGLGGGGLGESEGGRGGRGDVGWGGADEGGGGGIVRGGGQVGGKNET